jgi:hypothetical protein
MDMPEVKGMNMVEE